MTWTFDADETLIRLLARTDAVFVPARFHQPGWIQKWEARQRYADYGLSWASGATGNTEAKRAQRAIEALQTSGLVKCFRPKGAKTLFLRLTATADDLARTRCGLPTFAESAPMLAKLSNKRWTPETTFSRGRGWGDGNQKLLIQVEERILPHLVRGTVECLSNTSGRVFYRLPTPAPRKKNRKSEKTTVPTRDDALIRVYDAELGAALTAISTAPTQTRDIGPIPLGSSDDEADDDR